MSEFISKETAYSTKPNIVIPPEEKLNGESDATAVARIQTAANARVVDRDGAGHTLPAPIAKGSKKT